MKIYRNWNREKNKWETYTEKEMKFGKSRTDKSKYRPNVSTLTGAEGALDIKGEFDFEDGKDDGSTNYLLRNKGLDIVELQERAETIVEKGNEIKGNLENEVMQAMAKEAQNALGGTDIAPRME